MGVVNRISMLLNFVQSLGVDYVGILGCEIEECRRKYLNGKQSGLDFSR
jgi:hypothetical protein